MTLPNSHLIISPESAPEIIKIAASTLPLIERAQGLLERLDRWLPVEATWLTLSDPESNVYATVGSTGLERSVLEYLDRPAVAQEIQLFELNQNRPVNPANASASSEFFDGQIQRRARRNRRRLRQAGPPVGDG